MWRLFLVALALLFGTGASAADSPWHQLSTTQLVKSVCWTHESPTTSQMKGVGFFDEHDSSIAFNYTGGTNSADSFVCQPIVCDVPLGGQFSEISARFTMKGFDFNSSPEDNMAIDYWGQPSAYNAPQYSGGYFAMGTPEQIIYPGGTGGTSLNDGSATQSMTIGIRTSEESSAGTAGLVTATLTWCNKATSAVVLEPTTPNTLYTKIASQAGQYALRFVTLSVTTVDLMRIKEVLVNGEAWYTGSRCMSIDTADCSNGPDSSTTFMVTNPNELEDCESRAVVDVGVVLLDAPADHLRFSMCQQSVAEGGRFADIDVKVRSARSDVVPWNVSAENVWRPEWQTALPASLSPLPSLDCTMNPNGTAVAQTSAQLKSLSSWVTNSSSAIQQPPAQLVLDWEGASTFTDLGSSQTFQLTQTSVPWTMVEIGGTQGPMNWTWLSDTSLTQSSNIGGPSLTMGAAMVTKSPVVGGIIGYVEQFTFSATIEAVDDDGVGLVFNWQDQHNFLGATLCTEADYCNGGSAQIFRLLDGVVSVLAETAHSATGALNFSVLVSRSEGAVEIQFFIDSTPVLSTTIDISSDDWHNHMEDNFSGWGLGVYTRRNSGGKYSNMLLTKFGARNVLNPGQYCDVSAAVTSSFYAIRGSYRAETFQASHPDDNWPMQHWGQSLSVYHGYVSFGTPHDILVAGSNFQVHLAGDSSTGCVTTSGICKNTAAMSQSYSHSVQISPTWLSKPATRLRFGAGQSADVEKVAFGGLANLEVLTAKQAPIWQRVPTAVLDTVHCEVQRGWHSFPFWQSLRGSGSGVSGAWDPVLQRIQFSLSATDAASVTAATPCVPIVCRVSLGAPVAALSVSLDLVPQSSTDHPIFGHVGGKILPHFAVGPVGGQTFELPPTDTTTSLPVTVDILIGQSQHAGTSATLTATLHWCHSDQVDTLIFNPAGFGAIYTETASRAGQTTLHSVTLSLSTTTDMMSVDALQVNGVAWSPPGLFCMSGQSTDCGGNPVSTITFTNPNNSIDCATTMDYGKIVLEEPTDTLQFSTCQHALDSSFDVSNIDIQVAVVRPGCTNQKATNYCAECNQDDGSCFLQCRSSPSRIDRWCALNRLS